MMHYGIRVSEEYCYRTLATGCWRTVVLIVIKLQALVGVALFTT